MQTIINLIFGFFKVVILLIGGIMLVGGGSCAAIMLINSFGRNNLGEMLGIALIAIIVALIGWGLIKAVTVKPRDINIENSSQKDQSSNDEKS